MERVIKNFDRQAETLSHGFFSLKSLAYSAALIFCLAAAYLIINSNFSENSNRNLKIESVLEPGIEQTQSPRILILPSPKLSDSLKTENSTETRIEPAKPDKVVEKIAASDLPAEVREISERDTRPVEVVLPPLERARISLPKRTEKRNRSKSREVTNEPVPDIESIFTGRTYDGEKEKSRNEDNKKRGRGEKSEKRKKKSPVN